MSLRTEALNRFARQVNQWGAQGRPFFFLVDFEGAKPIAFPLEPSASAPVAYQLPLDSPVAFPFCRRPLPGRASHPGGAAGRGTVSLKLIRPPDRGRYGRAFSLVQHHLHRGDSYLLNLTFPSEVTLQGPTDQDLLQLLYDQIPAGPGYKLLRQGDFLHFSPEIFIRIREGQVYTYPMKGTRDAGDSRAEELLYADEKESCEHNTIVDLLRNDLSQEAFDVEVLRYRYCQRVKTHRGDLLQLSSEIRGTLPSGWPAQLGDLLADLLPAGSVSGAPKDSTCGIIARAEEGPRGYYTGVFGVFDGKNLDSAVNIRYIEERSSSGGNLLYVFRSGGGITTRSREADEYEELLRKVYVPVG